MKNTFETIVLGLGAMGSAAVYQLAKRGNKVLGLDQFSVPHVFGSTHGDTRIIRQATGEGEEYVPLGLRSYELWREIERTVKQELLTITGGLILESQGSSAIAHGQRNFLAQTVRCAKNFGIRHEILDTRDVKKRYPQFAVTNEIAYFEYQTGYLRPELCVRAQLHLAEAYKATIQTNEKVISVIPTGNKVRIKTRRADYESEKLIIAAGPWVAQLLAPAYAQYFKVYRQVTYWFHIEADAWKHFTPGKFPIFIWIFEKGGHFAFYGFPSLDGKTIKVATEQYRVSTTPQEMDRKVSEEEKKSMFENYVGPRLTSVTDRCERAVTCLYTTTPDSNFVIDFHPEHNQILIASPCSGHGFKHSAAIGEVLAELIMNGRSRIDISRFRIERFHA